MQKNIDTSNHPNNLNGQLEEIQKEKESYKEHENEKETLGTGHDRTAY